MFKHGDVIEYNIGNQWHKGIYVAPNPLEKGFHIHLTASGFVSDRREAAIRKPKVKKEGYLGIMQGQLGKRWQTSVYDTEAELKEVVKRLESTLIAVAKVEWEE